MFFIEVGSCNFDTCEKLIKNGWNGIVIEPVKYYFDSLPKYNNIFYENIAIDICKDYKEIEYINPEKIDENNEWLSGISSINKSNGPLNLSKNKINFKNIKKKNIVKTDTLNNICDKYNVMNIDFLKIDTEGHDLIVLKSINLERINVKLIKIEHKHLDENEIKNYLEEYNYLVYIENDDIYAIK